MATDKNSQTIKLKDGRTLGYAEYGAPQGKSIFFFHGNPSSRLAATIMDETAKRVNACIIALDRPSIGLSDCKPGRQYLDWPDDVTELADALGVERFAILGVSSGGPHAAACAFKIPERLTVAAIVSSPCPFTVPAASESMSLSWRLRVSAGRRAPWLVGLFFTMVSRDARRDPVSAISRTLRGLPEPDRVALARPDMVQPAGNSIREAFRTGTRGAAWDYSLMTRPWGFHLEDISVEVQLWHGEADAIFHPRMGHYLADTIPNCRPKFVSGEGHISLMINHMEDILSDLVA